ncbi:MAG: secretin N-terminal domain-containing protein [Verrucomicrobiota bacterium]|jgi:type II secretory pathway component GspD/PulD (secretin)
MKKIILSLMAAGMAGLLMSASAQPAPSGDGNTNAPAPDQPGPPPDLGGNPPEGGGPPMTPDANNGQQPENSTNQVREPEMITPSQRSSAAPEEIESQFIPPTQAGTNFNDLTLNFTRAPLNEVLDYLSDAAGFIIVQDTRVSGTVTVRGKHLTSDEAADLLNAVLNKNGYAAIRDGRTLTIVDKNDAKTRGIPVKTGNIPEKIPKTDEIITQIIPIRFVEARQLVSDLSSFVSPQATVVANEAGNSIVITDTQANIRHLAEIIKAVDDSAEAETEIRVFKLEHANPNDVATELTSIFPSSTSGNGTQSPIRFGGGGPGGGGPGGFFRQMMANAATAGNSSSDRIKKATQVSAVADSRIQAVIVTGPKDLMDQIASMMKDLDVASDRDQDVYVMQMKNGDAQAAALVLQGMFQSTSSRNQTSSQNQNSALTQRQINNNTSSGSSSSGTGTGMGTSGGSRTGGGTAF